MSCMGFLSPQQRAALAASSSGDADGAPLSSFASPPHTAGKVRRVHTLAASPRPEIRESAALSQHAPDDVLARLASDAVSSVRRCVARNERTPEATLRVLARDHDPLVRGWVAANAASPAELRADLARDSDPAVRAVVGWAQRWPQ